MRAQSPPAGLNDEKASLLQLLCALTLPKFHGSWHDLKNCLTRLGAKYIFGCREASFYGLKSFESLEIAHIDSITFHHSR